MTAARRPRESPVVRPDIRELAHASHPTSRMARMAGVMGTARTSEASNAPRGEAPANNPGSLRNDEAENAGIAPQAGRRRHLPIERHEARHYQPRSTRNAVSPVGSCSEDDPACGTDRSAQQEGTK